MKGNRPQKERLALDGQAVHLELGFGLHFRLAVLDRLNLRFDPGFDDPLDITTGLWFLGAWTLWNTLTPAQQAVTDPEIFVIGDTAAIVADGGKPVPGIGDAAKQAGRHAARVIRTRLTGSNAELPFHYRHLGDIATIGRSRALVDFGWLRLTGWVGWWTWGLAHIYFLIGLKNRIFVALNWLWIYLTGYRSARLITQDGAVSASPAAGSAPKGTADRPLPGSTTASPPASA